MANTLFHYSEHSVPYSINTLFYTVRTFCFLLMEQSVHVCELMCYPYIENNNEGFEGTESYVGDIKKAQAVYLPTLLFLILGLYYSPG